MKIIGVLFFSFLFISLHAQETPSLKDPEVASLLAHAKEMEAAGDLKEATRFLNLAAIRVWEDKKFQEAIGYFNRSIDLNFTLNNLSGVSKLHSNLGMIYSDLGEFQMSLDFFQRSLDYRLAHGEKTEIISTYINKGVVLNSLGRYNDAGIEIEKALQIATEMSDASQMKSCYGILAETYEKAGNNEKTMHYFNLYKTFHEMIQRNRSNEAKKELESAKLLTLQTELEKKEQELKLYITAKELKVAEEELQTMNSEITMLVEGKTKQELAMSLLEREIEVKALKVDETEHVNHVQKIWISAGGVGLLLTGLFSVVLFRNNRYKKRTNQLLARQNEEIKTLNDGLEVKVEKRTEELHGTMRNLEIRNRDLDQFSHVISHNLRGPVARILGLSRIINRENPSDPINGEIFNRLVISTENLDHVVKDLGVILEIKDNEALVKQETKIDEALASARKKLNEEIRQSGASIETILPTGENVLITVKAYLESIVFNLLSNALKYKSSKRKLAIKIAISSTAGQFKMSMKDNGIGIPFEGLEKIFDPYKRLNIDSEGKGLGLYMVKAQVEALSGKVEVTSTEDEGSCFTVQFPI